MKKNRGNTKRIRIIMDGYIQTIIIIGIVGLCTSLLSKKELIHNSKRRFISHMFGCDMIFYWILCGYRGYVGHGQEFLGQSFVDKGFSSYIKMTLRLCVIAFFIVIISYIYKGALLRLFYSWTGWFASLMLLYSVLYKFPKKQIHVCFGINLSYFGIHFLYHFKKKRDSLF